MNLDKEGLEAAKLAFSPDPDTIYTPYISAAIAAYLSALPNAGDELVAKLRAMCIDWDARPMDDGELPRIEPHCRDLREAADAIVSLTRTRDAGRANFLTMQGAAAQLLKRAQAAEAALVIAEASLASAQEALDWYADRVGLAGAMTAEGAKARAELTQDNGARALKEVR